MDAGGNASGADGRSLYVRVYSSRLLTLPYN